MHWRIGKMPSMVVMLAALASGCQSGKDKPLPVPQADVKLEQFIGTPLSGPRSATAPSARPEDVMAVRVRVIALESMPAADLQPLAARARLITVTRGGTAMIPVPLLTGGSRFAESEEAASKVRSTEMQSFAAALIPGTTTRIEATEQGQASADARRIALEVHRPTAGDTIELALLVEDWVLPPKPDADGPATVRSDPPPPVFQREMVTLDPIPAAAGMSSVLLTPIAFADSAAKAIAFTVDIQPGSADPAHAKLVEQTLSELKRTSDLAARRPPVGPFADDASAGFRGAFEQLSRPRYRRAAILFLADQTQARICEDVALVADETTIAALADQISKKSPRADAATTLGWELELTTVGLLTKLQSAGRMPPELAAVLILHLGEAGRNPSSLEHVVRGAANQRDLQNRLVAENLVYLEDSSPASRVRAFDWLKARGLAPADYDPMGNDRSRRDALERALNPPTTQQASR